MAAAASLTIEYMRGDSYPKYFTVIDTDTKEPVPLDGYTVVMTVDENPEPKDSSSMVFQIDGVVVPDEVGKFYIHPTESNNNIAPNTYYFDFQIINSSLGIKRTIAKGKYKIYQDINKT